MLIIAYDGAGRPLLLDHDGGDLAAIVAPARRAGLLRLIADCRVIARPATRAQYDAVASAHAAHERQLDHLHAEHVALVRASQDAYQRQVAAIVGESR